MRMFVAGLLTVSALAQTSTMPNEGLTLGRTAGTYELSWWGVAGRTYFIQQSDDLFDWEYLPVIETGADAALAWGFSSTGSALFLRLRYSDTPTSDPFGADFDGDYVGNLAELLNGTDPLHPGPLIDTDGDGLDDRWELAWGLNPNVADSHLRLYGMETALERFQTSTAPPPPGEAPTAADYTTARRVHLWQTPHYEYPITTENPHASHYDLSWDLADPAQTGNVAIQIELEEGQWSAVTTVPITDRYIRVAAPPRSQDAVKIRKRLVLGHYVSWREDFNYRLRGDAISNESQVKVRLRTRTRTVLRQNPAIIQFLSPWENLPSGPSGLTYLWYKKAVSTNEWRYEDSGDGFEFEDDGKRTETVTVDTTTGMTTWHQDAYWTSYARQEYGPAGQSPTSTRTDNRGGRSVEVDTFESVSPALTDPYTRVAPQGLALDISTKTYGSGAAFDLPIWTEVNSHANHLTNHVTTTSSGMKHLLGQRTERSDFASIITGSESKEEWDDTMEGASTTSAWRKTTNRDENGGTVQVVSDGNSSTTSLPGIEEIDHRFKLKLPLPPSSSSPSFYENLGSVVSGSWYSKSKVALSVPYSEIEFLTEIANALPSPIGPPALWEDAYEDSFSSFQTLSRSNVTYPGINAEQGGKVSENSLFGYGIWGTVQKSEYWLECNDCLQGGTAMAVETWENGPMLPGTLQLPGATGTVRIITLPIGAKPGRVTKSAVFTSEVPTWLWNQSRFVNVLPVKILEVSFSGDNYWHLRSDRNVGPAPGQIVDYTEPHWRDTNGDSHAITNFDNLTNGERNFPVAFTRNTKPKVKAKLRIDGFPLGTSVGVRATSPQGPEFPERTVPMTADGIVEMTEFTESLTPWQNTVRFWSATGSETFTATGDNAFLLDWEVNVGEGGWVKIGRTKHTVYITYADPITTANDLRRETLFNTGCRNAAGGTTQNLIVPAIYSEFTDRWVERVKPSSGERDGDPMEYWATNDGQRATTEKLLENGTAACGAWARFFIDCLRAQGIDAELSRILPKALGLTDALAAALAQKFGGSWTIGLHEDQLFVRNWNIADTFNPVPENGVAAQHNPDPNSQFDDHSVARYGGKIYDPSYGITPFLTLLEWENASLAATGTLYTDATRDNGAKESGKWIFKPNIPATEETTIGPQAWELGD